MKRILRVLLGIMLIVAFTGEARAITFYHAGYYLNDFLGYPYRAYGTAATISIPSQTPLSGDTVAFWTSLDQYRNNGEHWWAQAGYVIGLAPNGVTYMQPEMYIETNGASYSFSPMGPANWNTAHSFQISVHPISSAAIFAIDGNQVAVISMPPGFNEGGDVSASVEVNQRGPCCSDVSGSWSNLQFYECWIVGQSCWRSWDCSNCSILAVSTPPYYVQIFSSTAFNVYTSGGGGCGGKCFLR